MAFTVSDFEDLVRLLGEHPEWQARLRPVILGEEILQIPGRMDRVEAALERTGERIDQLTVRMDQLTVRMDELAVRMDQLSDDVQAYVQATVERTNRMEGRMGNIEGELLEIKFSQKPGNWVRKFMSKPVDVSVDEVEALHRAVASGALSDEDIETLASLDAILRGVDVEDGAESYLAVELSHTVNAEDVERAEERANLLKRAGLRARPFVGGYNISTAAEGMLAERGVLVQLRRQPA